MPTQERVAEETVIALVNERRAQAG